MKRFLFSLLTLVLIGSAGYVGYLGGKSSEQAASRQEVAKLKKNLDTSKGDSYVKDLRIEYLESEYNKLTNDYNDLRSKAIQYINASQYRPRQSINCSSNLLSNTVYTNCY